MRQLNSLAYTFSRLFWVATLLATLLLPSPISTARAAPELDTNDEIVFLTNEGEIRVFDPLRTGGATEVQFRSGNDKGYFDFVLGDVNNDGDKEIIAIGNDAAKGFVIYDPVVTSGVNDGLINGIPWRKLYQLSLPGAPSVVAAGDFDPAVGGDEILVGYASGSGSRVDIYKGNAITHDGTNWIKHIADQAFSNIWRDAAVGDLIPGGAAEVILIDPPSGITRVYRPDAGFTGLCEYVNAGARPYDVSIGQWSAGGAPEFGMVRAFDNDSGFTQARFNVFGCNTGGRFDVDYGNVNHRFRDPFTLVAADVNNSGEDEFFMLRNLPSGSGGHLLGRNRATDINGFEVTLDADNGYQAITAGDVDGDGKKEVIIMRNNNIRVFTDPEKSSGGVGLVNNYALDTNRYSLESGDVDKNGFQVKTEYKLISDVPAFNVSVGAGDKKTNAGLFTIKLNVDNISKQHLNPPALEGFPAGLAVNFEVIGSDDPNFTPTSYLFHVDATNVTTPRPGNPYQGFFVFSSSDPEVPEPLRIPVAIEVSYARLEIIPTSAGFVVFPCQGGTPQSLTQTIKVEGTAGVTFKTLRENLTAAGVMAAAPWLSVSPSTGTVGDTLTLSFDPSKWTPRATTQTQLYVVGSDGKTDGQLRTLTVSLLCATFQLHMPIIGR